MAVSKIDLGRNLRAFRKKMKLSLTELSTITGIAASNLSSMELGKSSPTLETLAKLAEAFGIRAGALLDEVLYRRAVLCPRQEGEQTKTSAPGLSVSVLTEGVGLNRMESRLVLLGPSSEPIRAGSTGTDRFVYCLRGRMRAQVGEDGYLLRDGDSLYLLPEADAELGNGGSVEASFLIVNLKSPSGHG
jgi:transcriptional regulator with XRE-family HTH domain